MQICGEGDYQSPLPFALGSREKGKLDRRGEEGDLRNKKAAASRFQLFFVIGTTGNGLCIGRRKHGVRRMAPPDCCEIDCGLLALEIASKPGWPRFASLNFSKAKAGLKCHASVGGSFAFFQSVACWQVSCFCLLANILLGDLLHTYYHLGTSKAY